MTGVSDPGYRCARRRDNWRAKLFLPTCTLALECLLYALNHDFADAARIAKADLAFRRMHIYVDACWIDLEKEKCDRILSFHQRSVIALAQGRVQQWILYRAAIHKSELLIARLPAGPGPPDKSGYANLRRGHRFHLLWS